MKKQPKISELQRRGFEKSFSEEEKNIEFDDLLTGESHEDESAHLDSISYELEKLVLDYLIKSIPKTNPD